MTNYRRHHIYRFCCCLLLLCCLLQLSAPAFSHALTTCPGRQIAFDYDHTDQDVDADVVDDEVAVLPSFWSFGVGSRTILPLFSPFRFTPVYSTPFLPPE